jgi:hypothetical protein
MPRDLDYDSAEFESASLFERFPNWALGLEFVWREYALRLQRPEDFQILLDALAAARSNERPGGDLPGGITRIFISHKQENRDEALRVAWLANQAGHHFWLDILAPTLNGTALNPIQTACVIEMGLLNCSHVIALVTPESRPSRWIPYEYGRVKEPTPYGLNSACWLHPTQYSNVAEYLFLGTQTRTEEHITRWLGGPGPGNRPVSWADPAPPKLPS